jgi:molybdenum cofactor guanylyltransferase
MAGGKSRRFGQDKALLTIHGETLLARALRILAEVTRERLIIGPPERAAQAGGAPVIPDEFPETGPLGGIYTALHAAANDWLVVVACDMPFLNPDLLRYLLSLAPDSDVVLPAPEGHGEQLHAVYRRSCLDAIRRQIESGDYKIDRFFAQVSVRLVGRDELRSVDPDLRSFRNVNTPEEWAEAQSLLSA